MVDLSGGLHQQLKLANERALKLRNEKRFAEAADEFERCARLMKELVKEVVSDEAKEKRLRKARQYLQLAENTRALVSSPSLKTEPFGQEELETQKEA